MPIKALGLLSGGLDSTLALRLIYDQGIEVIALHFDAGFGLLDIKRPQGESSEVLAAARALGVGVEVIDISNGFLDLLHNPRYGYGKNVNPCVDCHIKMLHRSGELLERFGAQFVFTGEVLGQRPMSQNLAALKLIARESGIEERILRPLSALLLPPTLPEREGWVNRSKLKGFCGRSRKPQMALAAELGVVDYPQPAGGCSLTDPQYSRKVRDLWDHSAKNDLTWDDYLMLGIGRHIRLGPRSKIIVGRNERENLLLDQHRKGRVRLEVEGFPGPVALMDGEMDDDILLRAAQIVARYSDGRDSPNELSVKIDIAGGEQRILARAINPKDMQGLII